MDAAIKSSPMNSGNPRKMPEQSVIGFVRWFVHTAILGFQDYGWHILGAGLVCLYVGSKIKPHVDKWLKEKEDREFAAKFHKDPELVFKRHEAFETARLKMAQKYEADAERAAERKKELEERKRQEWLQRQEGTSHPGRRLNGGFGNGPGGNNGSHGSSTKKSARLKEDYNPLMGGGSRGYRPTRRSVCPSGGCG